MRKSVERRGSRRRGDEYTSVSGKIVAAKMQPDQTLVCKCAYQCHSLSHSHRCYLFKLYRSMENESQRSHINSLIEIIPVQRRYGTTEESSRRRVTACYRLLNEEGKLVSVCRGTFMNTFGLTKKTIEVILQKKQREDHSVIERRGGKHHFKYTEQHHQSVKDHINSIPRQESHYRCKILEKEYLSSDLSYSKLHKAYLQENPDLAVTIEYYKKVFKQDFSKLSFRGLCVDSSRTCDPLSCHMKSTTDHVVMKMEARMSDDDQKAENARSKMTIDRLSSPNSNYSHISTKTIYNTDTVKKLKSQKRSALRKAWIDKLRKDPVQHAIYLAKAREKYHKRRKEGKVIFIRDLGKKEREELRRKNKEASKRYREKKKICTADKEREINDKIRKEKRVLTELVKIERTRKEEEQDDYDYDDEDEDKDKDEDEDDDEENVLLMQDLEKKKEDENVLLMQDLEKKKQEDQNKRSSTVEAKESQVQLRRNALKREQIEKLREDPVQCAIYLAKERERYQRERKEERVLLIQDLTKEEREARRKQNKEAARRYRAKKKFSSTDNIQADILPKEDENSWNSVFIKSEPLEYDSDDEKRELNGQNTQSDNLSNRVENALIKTQAHASKLPKKSIQKLHYCHQCQREYKTARSLKRHMNTHALVKGPKAQPKKKHVCEICNKGCASPSKLQSHYHTHLEVAPFECDMCQSRFRSYYTMKYHIMAHMQVGGRHKCPICAKSYVRSSRLRDHMYSHSQIKPFECEVCKKSYSRKNDLKVHMITHAERKTFHCEICSKGFTNLSYLKMHTKLHSDNWSHVCNVCGKRFHKISYLKIHMNRHTGVKPFECDICKKKFPSRASMKCHVVAHMEEGKSHKCPVCNNCYQKASMLKEHLRLHTGAKPYECKVCEKSFMRKGGLTQHMLTHDKKRPFLCGICNKSFKTHGHLKIHQKIHLNMDSFLCEICHKSFRRYGHLTLHKKMHSKDNDSRGVKAIQTNLTDETVIFVKSEIQEDEEEEEEEEEEGVNLQGQDMSPEKMIKEEKNTDHTKIGKERKETDSIVKTEVKREICDEDTHFQCQEDKNLNTSETKKATLVSVKKEPCDILNSNSEIEFQDVKIES